MFPGMHVCKNADLLRDRPCLALLIASSNFPVLFLQNNIAGISVNVINLSEVVLKLGLPFPEFIQ